MQEHAITPEDGGAKCTCGKEWSVWTSKRRSGWSAAHDAARTANLLRATAYRHATAQNKKLNSRNEES